MRLIRRFLRLMFHMKHQGWWGEAQKHGKQAEASNYGRM